MHTHTSIHTHTYTPVVSAKEPLVQVTNRQTDRQTDRQTSKAQLTGRTGVTGGGLRGVGVGSVGAGILGAHAIDRALVAGVTGAADGRAGRGVRTRQAQGVGAGGGRGALGSKDTQNMNIQSETRVFYVTLRSHDRC